MKLSKKILTPFILFLLINFSAIVNAQEYKVVGVTSTGNNSDVIDYSIPSSLAPGQTYNVKIEIVNNGITKWTKSDNYYLKPYEIGDVQPLSTVWGVSRVDLPYDINPSDKATFNFTIYAPTTSGTYKLRMAMARDNDYFGEYTDNNISVSGVSIPVGGDLNGNNSEFISVNVPQSMIAGEKYKVRLTMKNSGTSEWLPASYNEYSLVPLTDASAITYPEWNSAPVLLSGNVLPGQTSDIEFYVTAPLKSGSYDLQWMMKKGDNYFGQKSNRVTVNVTGGSTSISDSKDYNASFIEQTVPSEMKFNQMQDISITMSNTGNKTWTVGSEQLVLIDPKMAAVTINLWNTGYVQLPNDVKPGGVVTFNFKVKPTEAGWQYFQCHMMKEDGTMFGSPSKSVEVIISK